MNKHIFNLKAVVGAFAALVLTVALSWTFVDATNVARVHRHASHGLMVTISSLAR